MSPISAIIASATSYHISRSSAECPLVAEIEGVNANGASLVVERLEHVARWQAVAGLSNHDSHRPRIDPPYWKRKARHRPQAAG